MTRKIHCKWCGKQGTGSGMEKQGITTGVWSEMCKRCASKTARIRATNPWAGLLEGPRPVGTESTDEVKQ